MRKHVLVLALADADVPSDLSSAEVLVVAPALNSWLRHWLSDEDPARRRASQRMTSTVEGLRRLGVRAFGQVGDADPLQAVADALRSFPADELVIAGRPEPPNRRSRQLVERAARHFALAVRDTGTAEPLRTAA
jgi:hypothetical protein